MKLNNNQFEAAAYMFEKANGNIKSEYEEEHIAKSGLTHYSISKLETLIVLGIEEGLYREGNELTSAYWALSKRYNLALIPYFDNWLKLELERESKDHLFQIMIALANLEVSVFNKKRTSLAFDEYELNKRDAELYLNRKGL
jgi:hypothetical protein